MKKNKKTFTRFNPDDFKRGLYDDIFQLFGMSDIPANESIPYNQGVLSRAELKSISKSLPLYSFCVAKWMGAVGAFDSTVYVRTGEKQTDETRRRKLLLQDKTYRLVYTRLNWRTLENQIVELIAREGNAIVRIDKDDNVIIDSRFNYNIYGQVPNLRYAYKKNGQEVEGLKNLRHGVNLFHIRHPQFENWPIAPAPLEFILHYIRLEKHGVVANTKMFDKGMIGVVLLRLQKEMINEMNSTVRDENNENWLERSMRKINDTVAGIRNAFSVNYMPGVEDAIRLDKSNNEMQFKELLQEITPYRMAWGFLLTPADLGIGGATTYNNVASFDDSLYDKLGRHLERALDQMRNDWLLPYYGIKTNESYYIQYNPPADPKKIDSEKLALEEYKANAITQNEYRDIKGLPALPDGDRLISQIVKPTPPGNVIDAQVQPARYRQGNSPGYFPPPLPRR